jgi:hypothetical protein
VSPELKAALSAAEGLLNFYKPLQKLEAVLKVAVGAEQLVDERRAQADQLAKEIEVKQLELLDVDRKLAANTEAAARLVTETSAHLLKVEQDSAAERSARALKFEDDFSAVVAGAEAAKQLLADAKAKLVEEVKALDAEKQRLEAIVAETRRKVLGEG